MVVVKPEPGPERGRGKRNIPLARCEWLAELLALGLCLILFSSSVAIPDRHHRSRPLSLSPLLFLTFDRSQQRLMLESIAILAHSLLRRAELFAGEAPQGYSEKTK